MEGVVPGERRGLCGSARAGRADSRTGPRIEKARLALDFGRAAAAERETAVAQLHSRDALDRRARRALSTSRSASRWTTRAHR